jgi:hypothetical protein
VTREIAERTEELVETGLEYVPGEPVLVRVVRRGARIELSDAARAVALAGRPGGWWEPVERMVREEYSLNLSRRGEVFVPVVADGPGLEPLLARVAEASLAVFQELLDRER